RAPRPAPISNAGQPSGRPIRPSPPGFCPPSQRKTPARLPLSPTPHHLPKRNSSTVSPTASLHCWHSAMRRSPSWAPSSTQCCRSSALARAATSSTCPRISGGATRRERSGNFRPQSAAWEPQKSTGGGRKCGELFSVERGRQIAKGAFRRRGFFLAGAGLGFAATYPYYYSGYYSDPCVVWDGYEWLNVCPYYPYYC